MISSRTKEALARKRSEGRKLGRPKGSLSKKTKLTGKEKTRSICARKCPFQ
jgi:DNA invertase Pin-like site-specific DNA recombinase